MKTTDNHYQTLFALSKNIRILQGIVSLLDWDSETYMPPGAADIRSQQLETMAGIIHREKTSQKFATVLSHLVDIKTGKIKDPSLSEDQIAAVNEWRRDYINDTALPTEFVEEFARLSSQSIAMWRLSKKENDFARFAPYLDRLVKLCRKKAELLGYQEHPYDALLDQYEPGMTTAQVSSLFTKLRTQLTPMIQKLKSKSVNDKFLYDSWDKDKQIEFSHVILRAMGYGSTHGRLDFSAHPFSSASHPTDSRITTRLHNTSLISNISVVLHEGGHALYEMGLPQIHYGSPLGDARSLGVHESQSRWWETRIGLSRPFWQYFFPLLKETFRGQLDHITLDDFYHAINKVEPSFIRVEADEVTYPMHVILRFELEKELIEGSLEVAEIPEAWNAKMEKYLGIIPSSYAEGCLQDIHWSMGAFGYFPTYTLGNLYAAHLFESFAKTYPDWETQVAAGQLEFINIWLRDKIHQHGKRYSTHQLLKEATGKDFSVDPYLHYLKKKYHIA